MIGALLKDLKLSLVTDRNLFPDEASLYAAVDESLAAGLRAVQLREKGITIRKLLRMAYELREITLRRGARLFISDRADIAIAVEADGVHLGQNSIPASAAKKASEGRLAVGVSTHSLPEAVDAEREGADFITFGPIYRTQSKLKYGEPLGIEALRKVASRVSVPILAIGGIAPDRVKAVMEAGASGVALISAILASQDKKQTTERILRCLQ